MNRFFIRITSFSLFIIATSAASGAEFDREKYKPHSNSLAGRNLNRAAAVLNSTVDWTIGSIAKAVFWFRDEIDKNKPKPRTVCGPANSGSDYCISLSTFVRLKQFAKDDRKSRQVIPVDENTTSFDEESGKWIPTNQRPGLYREFLRQKMSAEQQLKRPISLSEYGTSQSELDDLLHGAYNRRACFLFREAKRKSHFGDIQFLNKLKAEFDRYSDIVKETRFAVRECRSIDNTFEEPSEKNWKSLNKPHYEKLLCEELRVLKKGKDAQATKRALKEYRSTYAQMRGDGLTIKRECLVSKQDLKTLGRRPEARKIASALQVMNQHQHTLEKEKQKLANATNDIQRARIQKNIDFHFARVKKAAKIYVRSTRKYRDKTAPKNMNELVAKVMGIEEEKTPTNIEQPAKYVTTVTINDLRPAGFEEVIQAPVLQALPPIPGVAGQPSTSEWLKIMPETASVTPPVSATSAEETPSKSSDIYYSDGE